MGSKTHVSRHVQRLIAGERDPRSLDEIFNWLRFHSFGLKAVQDVGHLIGHGHEKDRGLTWESLGRFLTMAQFHLLPMQNREEALPATVERVRAAALAAFETLNPEEALLFTGMPKSKAGRILRRGLAAIEAVEGNKIYGSLTGEEANLVLKHIHVVIGSPAFDENRLIAELADAFVRNNLISRQEVPVVHGMRQFVAVYCIEKMHLAVVRANNGNEFLLEARIKNAPFDWTLEVGASIALLPKEQRMRIGLAAFTTSCDARAWCHDVLLTGPDAWKLPIKLAPDGKLQPI